MPDLTVIGRWLLLAGLGMALVGGLLILLGRVPFLGHLPGDIRAQVGRVSCFVPIATSLLISVILTIVLNVIVYFLNRR